MTFKANVSRAKKKISTNKLSTAKNIKPEQDGNKDPSAGQERCSTELKLEEESTHLNMKWIIMVLLAPRTNAEA